MKITTWYFWSEDKPTAESWLDWANCPTSLHDLYLSSYAKPATLPLALKRRATKFGQEVLKGALGFANVGQAKFVMSSRFSELSREVSVLNQITTEGCISPADFSMSVHHALIGLLSIHTNNKQSHTAIASINNCLSTAFIEAAALLEDSPDVPVLIICGDESFPVPYCELPEAVLTPSHLAMFMCSQGESKIELPTFLPTDKDLTNNGKKNFNFMQRFLNNDGSGF